MHVYMYLLLSDSKTGVSVWLDHFSLAFFEIESCWNTFFVIETVSKAFLSWVCQPVCAKLSSLLWRFLVLCVLKQVMI